MCDIYLIYYIFPLYMSTSYSISSPRELRVRQTSQELQQIGLLPYLGSVVAYVR